MTHKSILATVIGLGLTVSTATLMAQRNNADVLLGQGLHQEEVDGDCREAIKTYQKVIAQRNAPRDVAARAQLHIGVCQEKLGQREARAAYELLITRYADQADLVAEARTRMAALAAPGGNSGIQARRVWEGAPVDNARSGTISRDGRYLVYQGPNERSDLYVRDLRTGLNRRLESVTSMTYLPVFSPDGTQVAYGRSISAGVELRLVALNASEVRVLHRSNEWGVLSPRDWSTDGKQILALGRRNTNSPPNIVLVSVADGSVRAIKQITYRDGDPPRRIGLSPDGRFVVYDYPAQGDSGQRDIFIVDTVRGEETRLVTRVSDERYPFFTPDGTGVVFFSTEGDVAGAWYQRVVDGKPQGAPVLTRSDVGGAIPIGFASNGSFYYSQGEPTRTLFVATLDAATGAVLVPPFAVTQRYAKFPAWSPDGRFLAYMSQDDARGGVMVIRSTVTGEERELAGSAMRPAFHLQAGCCYFSPDGRFTLVWGNEIGKQQDQIYRLDVRTGDLERLPGWDATVERPFFPNQESVVHITRDVPANRRIVVRDLMSGRETELYNPPAPIDLGSTLNVSANGRHVAFGITNTEARTTSVMVMTVTGGQPREVGPPVALPEVVDDIWPLTPDGRYVLYTTMNRESGARKLWRIAVEGGAPGEVRLQIDLATVRSREVSLHPDGRQIAFTSRTPGKWSVRALDNFLPKAAAAR